MEKRIIKTGYVSEIDLFLREFDKNRTQLPDSRVREVKKYQKIYAKRDGIVEEKTSGIWEGF